MFLYIFCFFLESIDKVIDCIITIVYEIIIYKYHKISMVVLIINKVK